jgi:hypothetical protein
MRCPGRNTGVEAAVLDELCRPPGGGNARGRCRACSTLASRTLHTVGRRWVDELASDTGHAVVRIALLAGLGLKLAIAAHREILTVVGTATRAGMPWLALLPESSIHTPVAALLAAQMTAVTWIVIAVVALLELVLLQHAVSAVGAQEQTTARALARYGRVAFLARIDSLVAAALDATARITAIARLQVGVVARLVTFDAAITTRRHAELHEAV